MAPKTRRSKETVTIVVDGDTFYTDNPRRKHSIRLANVGTPDKGEPGYVKATKALERLILGKEVTIDTVARDKYGRPVAKVKIGNRSVNKAMRD